MAYKDIELIFDKHSRGFVTEGHECLGAYTWEVRVMHNFSNDGWWMDANFQINDEAKAHWVEDRDGLVPVIKLERELRKFRKATEEAMELMENTPYVPQESTETVTL